VVVGAGFVVSDEATRSRRRTVRGSVAVTTPAALRGVHWPARIDEGYAAFQRINHREPPVTERRLIRVREGAQAFREAKGRQSADKEVAGAPTPPTTVTAGALPLRGSCRARRPRPGLPRHTPDESDGSGPSRSLSSAATRFAP
jgi:hypothetical protein